MCNVKNVWSLEWVNGSIPGIEKKNIIVEFENGSATVCKFENGAWFERQYPSGYSRMLDVKGFENKIARWAIIPEDLGVATENESGNEFLLNTDVLIQCKSGNWYVGNYDGYNMRVYSHSNSLYDMLLPADEMVRWCCVE